LQINSQEGFLFLSFGSIGTRIGYLYMPLRIRNADGVVREVADSSALEIYRHSTSHLMAAAVASLFPGIHLGIGPAISDGFYYDFECLKAFAEEDLKKIDGKMKDLIAQNLNFEPSINSKEEAID
jgi:threonyl-tRNA synthetase